MRYPLHHTAAKPMAPLVNEHRAEEQKQHVREEIEVHEKSASSVRIVYRAILKEGEEELSRSTAALAWSGIAAGLSMGFSLVAEGIIRSKLPEAPWRPLLAKFGYSIGFLIVILGRQQLFTENTLTPILPLLQHRTLKTLANVMRLWATVLLANLLAATIFAYVAASTGAFDPVAKRAFLSIGHEALDHPAAALLLRAIFAGWLIALMVWLLPVAETARVGVIIILTYIIGIAGLSHIIAGSIEVLYVVAAGEASWRQYLLGYALPTLSGNIIGGVALVAVLNHAQVMAGSEG